MWRFLRIAPGELIYIFFCNIWQYFISFSNFLCFHCYVVIFWKSTTSRSKNEQCSVLITVLSLTKNNFLNFLFWMLHTHIQEEIKKDILISSGSVPSFDILYVHISIKNSGGYSSFLKMIKNVCVCNFLKEGKWMAEKDFMYFLLISQITTCIQFIHIQMHTQWTTVM